VRIQQHGFGVRNDTALARRLRRQLSAERAMTFDDVQLALIVQNKANRGAIKS
jgi:hypothetical protein